MPRAFVFNMDEMACSDRTDRPRELKVIVLSSCEVNAAVPFNRDSKRDSMAFFIAADGSSMRPFAVVHRATVEWEFISYGSDQWRAMIHTQSCALMTRPLFLEWAAQELFPAVARRRGDLRYDGRAVLLLDGLGC
jgi:hypothetical protein